MKLQSLCPILCVATIEPCLHFWAALGFQVQANVKNDAEEYQFVLLARDGVTLMVQTRASLENDIAQLDARDLQTSVMLYIQVDDLDAIERALSDYPILIPRRETFYGAIEVGVREPGGNVLLFSTR